MTLVVATAERFCGKFPPGVHSWFGTSHVAELDLDLVHFEGRRMPSALPMFFGLHTTHMVHLWGRCH